VSDTAAELRYGKAHIAPVRAPLRITSVTDATKIVGLLYGVRENRVTCLECRRVMDCTLFWSLSWSAFAGSSRTGWSFSVHYRIVCRAIHFTSSLLHTRLGRSFDAGGGNWDWKNDSWRASHTTPSGALCHLSVAGTSLRLCCSGAATRTRLTASLWDVRQ